MIKSFNIDSDLKISSLVSYSITVYRMSICGGKYICAVPYSACTNLLCSMDLLIHRFEFCLLEEIKGAKLGSGSSAVLGEL